ncbi:hypothetical protein [Dialister sp.]|jgi:hypothetical protein|uniref:hypothetical protein n=1 Tax=Dialister sp. TaxID=1955814 RepID=UPI002E7FB5D5|nr:hypothetical protein [Dialister sp.]MEE3453275.1 hypothetical protein [Dialister sp.]
MTKLKRPPNVAEWDPNFLDVQYTPEEIHEMKKEYEKFKKEYGPIQTIEELVKQGKF